MDRRRIAYRELLPVEPLKPNDLGRSHEEAIALAQVMRDGTQSEFWPHVTEQINALIRAAEARFLDTLAGDYQTYVQWFSRRQALIQILVLPDRLIEAARPKEA